MDLTYETESESESHSVLSDSLQPHGLVNGILQARILELVAVPFSRRSSQPRVKARSPAFQVDSLPAEPQGKPKKTGLGSLSLLQGIFPTQELNQGLLYCRQILYQLSYERACNRTLYLGKLGQVLFPALSSHCHEFGPSRSLVRCGESGRQGWFRERLHVGGAASLIAQLVKNPPAM